jgi:hypothetical protein
MPEIFWDAFIFELVDCFTDCEGIWLCEKVGHQFRMKRYNFIVVVDLRLGLCETNKLSSDLSALVHQLIE